MSSRNITYRPPETDSEDEYDGFYFGDNFIKKERKILTATTFDQELYAAVSKGECGSVKQQVELLNFNVDSKLKDDGYTLLMHACKDGYLDIVKYLLMEKKANPNLQVDSITPLLVACDTSPTVVESHIVEKIVLLLIEHGAVVNVSDKYGSTPFMNACRNGHTAVVRHLLKNVSFDAVDNQGYTPIFHAVENNHKDIVKLLVDAGFNCSVPNAKGYSPRQVAEFHGFYDLLDILPKEAEKYVIPSQYLSYNTVCDHIPRIFLKSECPEYFQEINSILTTIGLQRFLQYFAKEHISLSQFLSMTDQQLDHIGIDYPVFRMKILKGLLDFHLHHWSKKSIARVRKSNQDNFYDILMIAANHLQHLVIIKSSLRFVKNNLESESLGPLTCYTLANGVQRNLNSYRSTIKELRKTVKYLASFSPPKNPLYIDYEEFITEKKRHKIKCYFQYTTLFIGISAILYFKMLRVF